MHITALVKSHDHVCCRYRVAAFRSRLELLGHDLSLRSGTNVWFLEQWFRDDLDVVVVQRKLFPDWQLRVLRRRARRLIYDFDDSIFLRSSYNPRGQDCPKRFQQFRSMVQVADAVVAGNAFLRDQATALTDPAKVHLIPTCVDVGGYPVARHESRNAATLVWIGSQSTLRGLERCRGLLDRVGAGVPGLKLRIICDRSLQLERLSTEFCAWSEAGETRDLAESDIGISWLPDDAWSEGKCGLKVLQYMAAGLPVVANPVGVQKDLVKNGETGFLARTPEEWVDAVRRLAADPVLRRKMGAAGRRRVEEDFDVSRGAALWQDLTEALDRRIPIHSGA